MTTWLVTSIRGISYETCNETTRGVGDHLKSENEDLRHWIRYKKYVPLEVDKI